MDSAAFYYTVKSVYKKTTKVKGGGGNQVEQPFFIAVFFSFQFSTTNKLSKNKMDKEGNLFPPNIKLTRTSRSKTITFSLLYVFTIWKYFCTVHRRILNRQPMRRRCVTSPSVMTAIRPSAKSGTLKGQCHEMDRKVSSVGIAHRQNIATSNKSGMVWLHRLPFPAGGGEHVSYTHGDFWAARRGVRGDHIKYSMTPLKTSSSSTSTNQVNS